MQRPAKQNDWSKYNLNNQSNKERPKFTYNYNYNYKNFKLTETRNVQDPENNDNGDSQIEKSLNGSSMRLK